MCIYCPFTYRSASFAELSGASILQPILARVSLAVSKRTTILIFKFAIDKSTVRRVRIARTRPKAVGTFRVLLFSCVYILWDGSLLCPKWSQHNFVNDVFSVIWDTFSVRKTTLIVTNDATFWATARHTVEYEDRQTIDKLVFSLQDRKIDRISEKGTCTIKQSRHCTRNVEWAHVAPRVFYSLRW